MTRVTLVSTEQFEVAVERDQPASVSQLAEIGASWMRNAMEAGAGHLAADGLARR